MLDKRQNPTAATHTHTRTKKHPIKQCRLLSSQNCFFFSFAFVWWAIYYKKKIKKRWNKNEMWAQRMNGSTFKLAEKKAQFVSWKMTITNKVIYHYEKTWRGKSVPIPLNDVHLWMTECLFIDHCIYKMIGRSFTHTHTHSTDWVSYIEFQVVDRVDCCIRIFSPRLYFYSIHQFGVILMILSYSLFQPVLPPLSVKNWIAVM